MNFDTDVVGLLDARKFQCIGNAIRAIKAWTGAIHDLRTLHRNTEAMVGIAAQYAVRLDRAEPDADEAIGRRAIENDRRKADALAGFIPAHADADDGFDIAHGLAPAGSSVGMCEGQRYDPGKGSRQGHRASPRHDR
ncbi:MAG: hypothetical protein WDN48_08865 [Pseudolabrys sp.]